MQIQNGPGPVRKLSAAIALAMMAPLAPMALAQGAMIEEVVVTGSRIARDPNATSSNPIQSVGAADIRLSGSAEATEYLRQQPALLTSLSSEASADSGAVGGSFSRIGQSVLALRGMGADRTLVLVDGRRHVSGVDGTQSVDIGTIPSALIERVETLTGGASSIYGADAVTGVVNFILKDDFEGVDINAQMSQNGSGDGRTSTLGLLVGQNFDEGRGNFTIGLDVLKRNNTLFGDRG
ncbi:MAG: TonB-dependent receptor plug domain-containing protein, partial [Gammaproteobacteria bacterium]|nr:TonB-dependent receptor plug domain-containing protein [Gammaproteobacteria bacterium]